MEILITNDDGWGSKGVLTLTRILSTMGHVTVVAPEAPRSGMSTAISVSDRMTLRKIVSPILGVDVYITNGTPADCVKLGLNVVYGGDARAIDLLVSGINHGHNASVNLIYSGTIGACLCATEHGIPAIGFSIDDHESDADFSQMEMYISDCVTMLMRRGFPTGVCYNVNAPKGEIMDTRWTRQAKGHWEKEMLPHVEDDGQTTYRLVGEFVNHEPEAEDTDLWAIGHKMLSIQPITIDMTHYGTL